MTNSDPMGGGGGGGSGGGGDSDSAAPHEIECFNCDRKKGESDADYKKRCDEFDRQLKEQEDAIKNMNQKEIKELLDRREIVKVPGGTAKIRDHAAQAATRLQHEAKLVAELSSGGLIGAALKAAVSKIMSGLAATHRLDMIAGGNPKDLTMGVKGVNSQIGPGWTGKRAEQLEKHAADCHAKGKKMNAKLKRCGT